MTALPERPRLAPKARLQFDRHEGRHVLLYPEKGLFLSETSAAIVELCTGEHRMSEIVDTLARAYPGTPRARIERDVVDFLTSLFERGLLREVP